MTWPEVIKQPEWENLSQEDKVRTRALWYDATIAPDARKEGLPEDQIAAHRAQMVSNFDTGEGQIASFLGAATQGFLGTAASAVQGLGALTGLPGVEELGASAQSAIESTFPTNPAYAKTNFVGNVMGNVGSFMVPGALGAKLGVAASEAASIAAKALQAEKALGALTAARAAELAVPIRKAAELGAATASNTAMFLSGAGSKAQEADTMGLTGGEKWMAAALGGATEVASENIPGLKGMKDEFAALSKIPGLSALSDGATRGLREVGAGVARNVVEELAAQAGGNLISMGMAPPGYQTPGFFSGMPQAAAGGAIGGLMMGGIEAIGRKPSPTQTDTTGAAQAAVNPTDAAIGQAVASGDQASADVLIQAKLKADEKLRADQKLYGVQNPNIPVTIGGDVTTSSGFALPPLPVPSALPAGEVPVIIAPSPNAPQVWTVNGKQFASEAEAKVYQATFTPGIPAVPVNLPTTGVTPVTTSGIEGIPTVEKAPPAAETPPAPIAEALPAAETAPPAAEAIPEAAAEPVPVIEDVPVIPAEVPTPIDATAPMEEQLKQIAENKFPTPKETPEQKAERNKRESQLLDVNEAINVEEAARVLNFLKDIGATGAQIVINDNGVADPLFSNDRVRGSRGVDENGVDTVFLNRNMVTKDTAVHEALGHGAVPNMQQSNPALFEAGKALLSDSDLLNAVRGRYADEGWVYKNDSDLMEEVMAHALGNNTGSLFAALAGNPKLLQQVKIWIAKAQVWFDSFLANKGIPPGMTVKQWAKKVYTHTIAGKVKETGKARSTLELATPGTAVAPAAPAAPVAPVAPAVPVAPAAPVAPVEITPRQTRHRVFEGGSPMRVKSGEGVLDAHNPDMAYRLTGQQQIDDILATGEVRAKEGKMRGGRSGETQWSRGHESLGYRAGPSEGMYVIETPAKGLNERLGGLPISEVVRIWKSAENGKWEDVTKNIVQAAPTPTTLAEAPPAAAELPVQPTTTNEEIQRQKPRKRQDEGLQVAEPLPVPSAVGAPITPTAPAKEVKGPTDYLEVKGKARSIDSFPLLYALNGIGRVTPPPKNLHFLREQARQGIRVPKSVYDIVDKFKHYPEGTTGGKAYKTREGRKAYSDIWAKQGQGSSVDVIIKALVEKPHNFPADYSISDFWEQLRDELNQFDAGGRGKGKKKKGIKTADLSLEGQMERGYAGMEADTLAFEKTLEKAKASDDYITPENLDVGDVFTINGDTITVTDIRNYGGTTYAVVESNRYGEQNVSGQDQIKVDSYTPQDPNKAAYFEARTGAATAWEAGMGEDLSAEVSKEEVQAAQQAALAAPKATTLDFKQGLLDTLPPEAQKAWSQEDLAAAEKFLRDKDSAAIAGLSQIKQRRVRAYAMDLLGVQDIKYSLGPPVTATQDAEYMAAVDSGDVAKQQELVNAAAKTAGNDLAHRGANPETSKDIVQFARIEEMESGISSYGKSRYVAKRSDLQEISNAEELKAWTEENYGAGYVAELNPPNIIDSAGAWDDRQFVSDVWGAMESGELTMVPGFATADGAVVFPGFDKAESADPVIRDKNGNVIPLSQRFNPAVSDIRYSLGPPVPFEKMSGTTQVATTAGSYRTAFDALQKVKPDIKNVLDYGAGLGLGADAIREKTSAQVDTLEVNPERWKSDTAPTYTSSDAVRTKYDAVINLNVLNVVPRNIRDAIVKNIGDTLNPGGVAAIGVRGWEGDIAKTKNFEPAGEEKAIYVIKQGARVFQKGFSQTELVDYLQGVLGSEFQVKKLPGIGNVGALITRSTVSGVRPSLGPPSALPVTATQDAEYMAAVDSGDVAKQQRLVDAAAKDSGFYIKANHTSPNKGIEVFNRRYRSEVLDMPNLIDESVIWFREGTGPARYGATQYNVFLKITDPWVAEGKLRGGENGWNRFAGIVETLAPDGNPETFVSHMKKQGWDGVKIVNVDLDLDKFTVYGVFDSNQIKSADPVTYDKNGNVIPLSQRFNPAVSDIRYSLGPPNLPADSDVNLRPSGVAKNRPNSYTRGLFEGQTYQGESMQEAWDEAADIYEKLESEQFAFEMRMDVFNRMKNNDYSNSNPMTPGAFAGWMLLEQRNILEDENASEADKEIARDQQQRIVDMTTDFAAEAGQKVKGFHIGIAIAEGWTTMADFLERDSIHGGAVKAKAFTDNVKAQTQILGKLTTETLSTAPAADVTRVTEQRVFDVVRADESTISGAVENELNTQDLVDQVTAQDEITSQGWFQRGLERYSKEVQADIDAWLVHMQYEDAVALLSSGASPSLSAAERSAQVLEMIKKAGITTPAEARAALPKISQETERLRGKVFGLKTETAKPAKNKKMTDAEAATMSDAEMRATILSRFDNVMNFLMNQSKVPKAKSVRDKTINAIVSGMVSKAGISVPRAKITGDQRALALGLLLQNQKLAAEMVNEIHAALEGDETTKGAWKKSNLKSLFEVYVGKGFDTPSGADAKSPPYSEKQVTQLLNAELRKLNRSLRKVITDAALERKTAAELEAQLRDPSREFAKELRPEALNDMVNAVLAQYGKNAKQMADSVAKRKAEAAIRNAEAKKLREQRKEADKQPAADRAETRKALAEAARESRAKRRANFRDIRRKALRARRENVSAIREARKTGAPVPAVKPLTYQEEQELMRQRPGRVIDYLTRNFGFDLSSIVSLARAEDRKASLDDMVTKLADALGLTKAQAQLFMRPVIQEAMKSVDATRLKKVNKQIEDTAVRLGKTGIKKPKKGQKTEAQRLVDLAKLGGLNAKNVEDVMLNTIGAKKFTPEFKAHLEKLIQMSNDPALPPIARHKLEEQYVEEIQSARGVSLPGLYLEFMMSNIFGAIFSTLKVNAVWGFIKSTADTAAYLAGQTIFKGETGERVSLQTASSLAKIYTRAYFGGTQNQAKYLLKTGRTPQQFENDNYAQLQSSMMEILSSFPDTEIRLFREGKPLSPFWARKVGVITNYSKYTRRIMVATDMANRTPAMYMLRAANIAREIADRGGSKDLSVNDIDSAMYGSDFKTAVENAKNQARREVAAGIVGADEEGIRMEEILNDGMGKSLGLSPDESSDIVTKQSENAKRWTVANKTQGALGVITDNLLRSISEIPGLSLLLPAVRMPIGAFSQGIDWSPVGFVRYLAIERNAGRSNSITNAIFNRNNSRKGWYVPDTLISQEQRNEMLIKASVGTALMTAMAIALEAAIDDDEDKAAFYITNRGPSDIQKNKIWREKGNAPNIMRINGIGFNFQESPAAPLLLALGAWSDAKRYGKPGDELSDRISYAFTRSMSGFMDAAVLKNLHDVLGTFSGANATSASTAGDLTARLVSVGLFPRLGSEINQILYGQPSRKDAEWAGKALSTVPFIPGFFNKPALNWFGESIHGSRGNALGEVLPMLAHRISPILSDDPQMLFVARMGANALTTTRRLKDGTEVAEDYDLMRKWATDSGVAIRKFLTPERMAFFETMREKDVPTAEKAFDKAISDIRNRILSGYPQVIFRK